MAKYPGFEQFNIEERLEQHSGELKSLHDADVPHSAVLGDFCISVKTEGDKVCINAPIIGDICVKLPISVPNGTVAKVCATVKIFPPKVCITVYIGGVKITEQCFGT
jgi:hypothetical protein